MNIDYDEFSTSGTYAKWEEIGDCVEGRIQFFGADAGTDFDGEPCPQLVVETADGNVIINAGQANLRRLLTENAGRIQPGHGVRVTYSGNYQTKHGTSGKEFTLGVTKAPIAPVIAEEEVPF